MRPYAKACAQCQAACVDAPHLAFAGTDQGPDRRMILAKDAQDKARIKAERLKDALRANLRRRKAKPVAAAESDIAKSLADPDR